MDRRQWLVDAGLGDGPREPILLVPRTIQQDPFSYELIEDPSTWTLVHDKRGTFAEVVFSKTPVEMDAFRAPAREQVSSPDSWVNNTLTVMKRRDNESHLLRGRVYEVAGDQCPPSRTVDSREEWLELLTSQFGVYLGNVNDNQQRDLWATICAAHESWLEERKTSDSDDLRPHTAFPAQ